MTAQELRERGEFDRYELEAVTRIIEWFNENIKVPSILKKKGYNRCISWFKPESKTSLELMWELYHLLQSKGVSVEVLKNDEIGEILYEDEHQVVAQPWRHNRKVHE